MVEYIPRKTSGRSRYDRGGSSGPRRRSSSSTSAPVRRSYGGRPSASRGGGRGRSFGGQSIDISKFQRKAVITEEVERFIPEHAFIDFSIVEKLKENIVKKGYIDPTPIQDKTIPHILRGNDVVGIANTGTGKTAAFLIPLINKVLQQPKEKVLIVVPTRELATQIEDELRQFVSGMKIFSVSCVGGAPLGPQIRNLRYHNNFVIGTPGRLKDLIERRCLDLGGFNSVVLDEADRMLDMGFIHDMKYMMALMPKKRQTLFFSATLSREIEALIKEFLTEPVSISVKTQETAKNVDQDVIRVTGGKTKIDILYGMLMQPGYHKVLVFGKTKHGVEKLAVTLSKMGLKVESIHGNKSQPQRQRSLNSFKDGKVQILVATDVAARGLDISDVSHVINYDIPATYDDYIHRIGRTGRAGKTGKAITFIE